MDIKTTVSIIRGKLDKLEKLADSNSSASYDDVITLMGNIASLVSDMRVCNTRHLYAAKIGFREEARGRQVYYVLLGNVSKETADILLGEVIDTKSPFVMKGDLIAFSKENWQVLVNLWCLYRLRDIATVLGVTNVYDIAIQIRNARNTLQFDECVDRPCTLEDLREYGSSPYGVGTQFINIYKRVSGKEYC